jgi:hypothetical protein
LEIGQFGRRAHLTIPCAFTQFLHLPEWGGEVRHARSPARLAAN